MNDYTLKPTGGVMYDVERPAEFNVPVETRTDWMDAPEDYPDPNEPDTSQPLEDDEVTGAVQVEVVNDIPRPAITEVSTQRYAIPPGRYVMVAGARRNRTRLVFYTETLDTDLRFARHYQTLSVPDHAPVVPFEFPLVMNHNSEVWVTNVHATEDRHVCVVDEFVIEDHG